MRKVVEVEVQDHPTLGRKYVVSVDFKGLAHGVSDFLEEPTTAFGYIIRTRFPWMRRETK